MIEFRIDGEFGEWDAGTIVRVPILARARILELEKRMRQPADDVDAQRSREVTHEGSGIVEIIEEIPELEPGSEEHFRAVVRAMGGIVL